MFLSYFADLRRRVHDTSGCFVVDKEYCLNIFLPPYSFAYGLWIHDFSGFSGYVNRYPSNRSDDLVKPISKEPISNINDLVPFFNYGSCRYLHSGCSRTHENNDLARRLENLLQPFTGIKIQANKITAIMGQDGLSHSG